jgi:hypothetical protein
MTEDPILNSRNSRMAGRGRKKRKNRSLRVMDGKHRSALGKRSRFRVRELLKDSSMRGRSENRVFLVAKENDATLNAANRQVGQGETFLFSARHAAIKRRTMEAVCMTVVRSSEEGKREGRGGGGFFKYPPSLSLFPLFSRLPARPQPP